MPIEQGDDSGCLQAIAHTLHLDVSCVTIVRWLHKSFDIADHDQFYCVFSVVVAVPLSYTNELSFPVYSPPVVSDIKKCAVVPSAIIVGFGPAGMFAALEIIEQGGNPIIFERGKRIAERSADVQKFISQRVLHPESNIQFGEGGAGAYSDGKLFARRNNSTTAQKVLDTFIKFGAPPEIAYTAKPHVGTDVLRRIIKNIRAYILDRGAEINFSSKMTDIIITDGQVRGIVVNDNEEHTAERVYIAAGHSAQDVFALAVKKNLALEPKPIAIGLRIEHPAAVINVLRHGKKYAGHPQLGAATYSFTHTDRQKHRGAYSFCMCPGGEIVNASSQEGLLVVNGMSYASRASTYSNAAIVVTCYPADFGSQDVLAGMRFQTAIERKAFELAGRDWSAPAQGLLDFLEGRCTRVLKESSYKMGLASVDLREILPSFVSETLVGAFLDWQKGYPSFVSEEAVLLGVETRTSSPVRICRNDKYEALNVKGLYWIGESSGHTGGIVSSAMDGMKAVQA